MPEFFVGGINDDGTGNFANLLPQSFRETLAPLVDAFSAAQHSSQFYPSFSMQHMYYTRTGLDIMPIAGGAGANASRPVRLHSPCTKKAVIWEASRIGMRPVLPHPDTSETNPNEVLLKMLIIPHTPQLQPGGRVYLFAAEGCFIYGCFNALTIDDAHYAGASPCSMDQAEYLKLEGYQFSKELMLSKPPTDFDADLVKEVP